MADSVSTNIAFVLGLYGPEQTVVPGDALDAKDADKISNGRKRRIDLPTSQKKKARNGPGDNTLAYKKTSCESKSPAAAPTSDIGTPAGNKVQSGGRRNSKDKIKVFIYFKMREEEPDSSMSSEERVQFRVAQLQKVVKFFLE